MFISIVLTDTDTLAAALPGVGFSVEPRCVEQLPVVAERFVQTSSTVVVDDSREGWARALREIIALLFTGHVSSYNRTITPDGGFFC